MGAACCKPSEATRDPEDLTLDEVEMEELKVSELDDVFGAASDPVNSLVSLNNNIVGSVEALKAIASVLLGAQYVKVNADYSLALWAPGEEKDKELTAEERAELFKAQPALKAAFEAANAAGAAVKAAVEGLAGFELSAGKNDRLMYKRPAKGEDVDEAKVSGAKAAVSSFNNNLFKLKKATMQASLKDAMDFKKAAVEIIVNLRKRAKTLKPKAVVDPSGIAKALAGEAVEPSDVIKLDAGAEIYDALPDKYKAAYDAIFGEEGIVACVQGAIGELTSVKEKVDSAQSAVEGLPTDPEALKTMCDAAGLNPMQFMKVPGKVAANSKAFAATPSIMTTLGDTLTMVVTEIAAAVSAAEDVAGAA